MCTQVIGLFRAWDNTAWAKLHQLKRQMLPEALHLQHRYSSAIGSFASASALQELVGVGVLLEAGTERATAQVIRSILEAPRQPPVHAPPGHRFRGTLE